MVFSHFDKKAFLITLFEFVSVNRSFAPHHIHWLYVPGPCCTPGDPQDISAWEVWLPHCCWGHLDEIPDCSCYNCCPVHSSLLNSPSWEEPELLAFRSPGEDRQRHCHPQYHNWCSKTSKRKSSVKNRLYFKSEDFMTWFRWGVQLWLYH